SPPAAERGVPQRVGGWLSTRFRPLAVVPLIAAMLLAAAPSAHAFPGLPEFRISAQDATSALNEFGTQAGRQLLFDYDAVQGVRTQAVSGVMPIEQALARMLKGTGLTFEVVND